MNLLSTIMFLLHYPAALAASDVNKLYFVYYLHVPACVWQLSGGLATPVEGEEDKNKITEWQAGWNVTNAIQASHEVTEMSGTCECNQHRRVALPVSLSRQFNS